jgi:hypothetical protein
MADQVTTIRDKPSFPRGSVVKNRGRLWRVDSQQEDILIATTIDTGEPEQVKFFVPFEDIRPGWLRPPSPKIVGHLAAQDLLLRAYRLSLLRSTPLSQMHGADAPLIRGIRVLSPSAGEAPWRARTKRLALEKDKELGEWNR